MAWRNESGDELLSLWKTRFVFTEDDVTGYNADAELQRGAELNASIELG